MRFFYEENTCHVTHFFSVFQVSPFPGQEVQRGEPLWSSVPEFPPFFPPGYHWIERDLNKIMPGFVHLQHASICASFIKFLSSPLSVLSCAWHNLPATDFLLSTTYMKTSVFQVTGILREDLLRPFLLTLPNDLTSKAKGRSMSWIARPLRIVVALCPF